MSWESRLIRVAVGILKRGDKFLVAERPKGRPYNGYWEFPGGKLEANESGAQALKRELQEELGIDVLISEFLFEHIHAYPDKTVFLEMWLVKEFSGEPYNKENQILRWATLLEMKNLPLLEGNGPILEKMIGLL
jgi:8-oxo-dGTP diphosphatase